MSNKHYVETTFVSEERPPSTKMNTLNSRIANSVDMTGEALSLICGDDRVVDDPDSTTELKVVASGVPDMNVTVNTGYALVSGNLVRNESATAKAIVAPTTNPRYTIIQISDEGVITTKDGTEAASPTEPGADTDNIKLAAIYLPKNTTKIEDTDGGYGYIIDRRTVMALHPTTVTRHVTFYIAGTVFTTGGPNSDGYYLGTTSSGFTFGKPVTINKVMFQAGETPNGADLILTLHNVTDSTSDTATLSDGAYFGEDTSISLDLDGSDELAIQVTQVGSTDSGGWLNVTIQYILQ